MVPFNKNYLIIPLFLTGFLLPPQALSQDNSVSAYVYTDSMFSEIVENRKVPGIAVSYYSRDSSLIRTSYPSVEGSRDGSLFQVGSVGKIFTALAVLKLYDEGSLDLDTDIADYLGRDIIQGEDHGPVTLRGLLTHTSGFNERLIGYMARDRSAIQPLEQHLEMYLPERYGKEGEEISYSNYGYALAGLVVEKVSGITFTEYIERYIFLPLAMNSSTYFPDSSARTTQGYRRSGNDLVALPRFYRHPVPAGGAWSSSDDMSRFLQMLVSNRDREGEPFLSEDTRELLFKVQARDHEILPGYTIGLEGPQSGTSEVFSKGGSVPGYRSILVIFHDKGIGFFANVNEDNDEILEEFVLGLQNRINGPGYDSRRPGINVALEEFSGSYRDNRYSRETIENIVSLRYTNLWINGEGQLETYQDGKLQQYLPVGPLLFQNTVDPLRYMVFGRDDNGSIAWMARGDRFAGTLIPARYERVPWYESNFAVNDLIAYLLLVIGSFPIILLIRAGIRLFRKSAKIIYPGDLLVLLFSLITISYFIFYFLAVIRGLQSGELFFGMDNDLKYLSTQVYLMIILILPIVYRSVIQWNRSGRAVISKVYHSVYSLAAILILLFLYHWNFIGFNF